MDRPNMTLFEWKLSLGIGCTYSVRNPSGQPPPPKKKILYHRSPEMVFFENFPGILSTAFPHIFACSMVRGPCCRRNRSTSENQFVLHSELFHVLCHAQYERTYIKSISISQPSLWHVLRKLIIWPFYFHIRRPKHFYFVYAGLCLYHHSYLYIATHGIYLCMMCAYDVNKESQTNCTIFSISSVLMIFIIYILYCVLFGRYKANEEYQLMIVIVVDSFLIYSSAQETPGSVTPSFLTAVPPTCSTIDKSNLSLISESNQLVIALREQAIWPGSVTWPSTAVYNQWLPVGVWWTTSLVNRCRCRRHKHCNYPPPTLLTCHSPSPQ